MLIMLFTFIQGDFAILSLVYIIPVVIFLYAALAFIPMFLPSQSKNMIKLMRWIWILLTICVVLVTLFLVFKMLLQNID